jgi:hypothetical protein
VVIKVLVPGFVTRLEVEAVPWIISVVPKDSGLRAERIPKVAELSTAPKLSSVVDGT